MADKSQYSEVRRELIEALKIDLMGPKDPHEELDENPRYAYLVGMLDSRRDDEDSSEICESEIADDLRYEDSEDYTAGEDDDNEPISTNRLLLPSSIGISFYIDSCRDGINLDVSWGDYVKSSGVSDDNGRKSRATYVRQPKRETVRVKFADFSRAKNYNIYPLKCDPDVHVHVTRISLKGGYSLVTAYVNNERKNSEDPNDALMFQVEIKAYAGDGSAAFVAEHICRKVLAEDGFYCEHRPIMGRGRNCAAEWDTPKNGRATFVKSSFIPEYEFAGVSAAIDDFDQFYFSALEMSWPATPKATTIGKLNKLADSYENWINKCLRKNARMENADFKDRIGNPAISLCEKALSRLREGIRILETDDISYEAFRFMNRVILTQNSIKNYSKMRGAGKDCHFMDFTNPADKNNNFGWRPFQIAFILMNLPGIVDPSHEDREIVDLLYFPTGGGKTEAYLGLMAFVIANRRLRATDNGKYNLDGGVTVLLRYTLRLLTTQQRDRIIKMVLAAEMLRRQTGTKFGTEPISIGFWVGGGVTPNNFKDLNDNDTNAQRAKDRIYRQLINCPFCGRPLHSENFNIDIEGKSIEIYCSDPDKDCRFSSQRDNGIPLPVYLVDEEIYARCPTIILSTVDKFALLPWNANINALFGGVDRKCSRHGYVANGIPHPGTHMRIPGLLDAAAVTNVRPFFPPELIIQDELHLITGPLGTIYGAYETIIEDMCSRAGIKPKYVVSTATIRNAAAQTKCLYARASTMQFPPNGFESGDSYFIKEIPVEISPFRKYVGVCAHGQSQKTALLRVFAIILQTAGVLKDKYSDTIDPYYTLIGYFNSIRELGGANRLIQDDIPKRIRRIKNMNGQDKQRYLNRNVEITSRIPSYKIPERLKQLEIPCSSKECLDTALATNMISVGMDVARLGLMVMNGQPKQNSEYIQATSRVGREYPGLVVTLYNAHRLRDLSVYENFTGYHSQLYRFVEGTTATPFSARARDRVLHALVISAIRLKFPVMANDARAIVSLTGERLDSVKDIILKRLNLVNSSAKDETEEEIDSFIDWWKQRTEETKKLSYCYSNGDNLMRPYSKPHVNNEKATLQSMREVESSSNMFYYEEE